MKVEFEWHADGEGETIAQIRRRRFRLPGWVRRAALGLLAAAVVVAAAGYGVMRVRYARLSAMAEAEIGRLMERDRLKAGTMNGVSIEGVELRGDVAWVEVVEGGVRRARFYERRLAAGAGEVGWAETTPRVEFWGAAEEVQSGDVIVRYYRRDEPAVRALLPYLEKVAMAVAEDLRYSLSGRKVIIVVSPEEAPHLLPVRSVPPGARSLRREVRLTSPWVSGMPADGVWDQEWLSAISYEVAHGLALRAARSSAQLGLDLLQRALADEYAAWLSHGRDPAQAPLLRRVIERHGEGRLPIVFLSLKSARLPALFVVQWLGLYPAGDAVAYFELLLNVEREALLAGRTETFLLFQDPAVREEAAAWAERWSAATGGGRSNENVLAPAVVERVEMAGELALVTVREPEAQWDAWRRCASVEGQRVCRDDEWWNWLQARRVGRAEE